MTYNDFLTQKALLAPSVGLVEPGDMPAAMKRFQGDITRWAIRRGRAAIFAGTGLGKTFMQLAWGDRVRQRAGGELLILTPLAVAQQTIAEAKQWGVNDVAYARDQKDVSTSIAVTNYDRLDKFAKIVLGWYVPFRWRLRRWRSFARSAAGDGRAHFFRRLPPQSYLSAPAILVGG